MSGVFSNLSGLKHQPYIISLFLASIILSPNLRVLPGIPALRAEDILVFLIGGASLLKIAVRQRFRYSFDRVDLLIILMCFSAVISISGTSIIHDKPVIMKDFFVIFQMAKYYCIYIIAKSVVFKETDIVPYTYCVLIIALLIAMVGFAQYYNLLGVNNWLTPHFSDPEQPNIRLLLTGYYKRRIIGTVGNPNGFGIVLAVLYCLIISIIVSHSDKTVKKMSWIVLGAVIAAMLMTLSRTTYLIFGFLFVCTVILNQTRLSIGSAFKYLLGFLLVAILVSTYFEPEGFNQRVTYSDAKEGGSLHARIRDFTVPLNEAMDSIPLMLIGRGPSKEDLRTDSHNDYGWYLQRFGMLGLVPYVCLLLVLAKRAFRNYSAGKTWVEKMLYLSFFLILINWIAFGFGINVFKDVRTMSLNMLFAGFLSARICPKAAVAGS